MDRLSSIDAGFLAQERSGSHMHIGSVMLFDGVAPTREEFLEHMTSRLHLVPRYRQKLAWPRFELGRPLWIDDPRFNLDYHVRVTALPEPGTLEQLRLMAGRVFSQRLDRSKPLWEAWLVHGLEDDRFALINKAHHCLVDGVSGVDITTVLFDLEPAPRRVDGDPDPWVPAPEPSDTAIAARGVADLVRTPFSLAGDALSAATNPGRTLGQARDAAEAVGEVAWGLIQGAPETPLNQPCGSHRRVHWIHTDLAGLKAVKNALGGTVNDVFLNVVSGALRRWLHSRGVRTEGLELRGAVPVSVRAEDERGKLGNKITIMVGSLPVYAEDPVERQRIVADAMADLKESKQALGAELIAGLQDFAPPTIFAQASRLNFSPRMYNLLVTNVPGPQFPLYLLGREMCELVPIAFLAAEQILAVAIMSYNGGVDIGLIGDYDAMPDLEALGALFEESVAEVRDAAALSAEASLRA
ncbi:MAG TPA: wax ester/triacylglycerol synthase family O-acyltransferase [Solirubrobacteraceae bacterium]|jgi:WS/DGAT/MGAT family acyltransferase|nr:wax ester/triacylglycerol synthase family O-acyltransferase [Solirubrobacteraceae bacterium]